MSPNKVEFFVNFSVLTLEFFTSTITDSSYHNEPVSVVVITFVTGET